MTTLVTHSDKLRQQILLSHQVKLILRNEQSPLVELSTIICLNVITSILSIN